MGVHVVGAGGLIEIVVFYLLFIYKIIGSTVYSCWRSGLMSQGHCCY